MFRTFDKLFVAIVAAALFMPLGYRVCDAVVPGVDMPEKSDLEERNYQQKPELSAEAVKSGELQSDMEQMISDSVPKRRGVLMTNAAVQRAFIEVANSPFGFEVYPTFYGSHYLYDPSLGAVMQMPKTLDEVAADDEKWIARASGIISAHDNIRWAFYLTERTEYSSVSPAQDLMNNTADYEHYETLLKDKLPEGCTFISDAYDSTEEYYQNYFRTDHHWQIEGGLRAYRKICDTFGLQPATVGDVFTAYNGSFYGSNARSGLISNCSDSVRDVRYDATPLSVKINGATQPVSALDKQYGKEPFKKSTKYESVYYSYFHSYNGLVEIQNPTVGSGTLLIIGDSYTWDIDRLFAANYNTVYIIDPRHYKGSVGDFCTEHHIDDGLFLMCRTSAAAKWTASI